MWLKATNECPTQPSVGLTTQRHTWQQLVHWRWASSQSFQLTSEIYSIKSQDSTALYYNIRSKIASLIQHSQIGVGNHPPHWNVYDFDTGQWHPRSLSFITSHLTIPKNETKMTYYNRDILHMREAIQLYIVVVRRHIAPNSMIHWCRLKSEQDYRVRMSRTAPRTKEKHDNAIQKLRVIIIDKEILEHLILHPQRRSEHPTRWPKYTQFVVVDAPTWAKSNVVWIENARERW